MDKLQPIIAQRFWILIGLVIPLSMYGYFSANGAIKAATAAKESELDSVISGIPTGSGAPNEDYSKSLAYINDNLDKMVSEEILGLWTRQTERMTWPVAMEGKVPQNFMQTEDPTFTVDAGIVYKSVYDLELEELMQVVEPVYPVIEQDKLPKDTKQKVVLIPDVPRVKFGQLSVKPSDIWDAQIDIWLTRLIFESIQRTNEDADTVSEAVIRRIDKFQLVGGSGESSVAGAAAAGYEGGGAGYEGESMAMSYSMGAGVDGGMGAGGAAAVKSSVAFQPTEEFGSDADTSGAVESETEGAAGGYESMGGIMGGMYGGAAGGPKLRYIGEVEDAPYLERGFYMSVIIQQAKIPDFLTELVAAPWPIQIRRFSMGDNPYRKKETLGGYGVGGMMAGGLYGGGDMPYESSGAYGAPGGYGDAGALGGGGLGGGLGDSGYGEMGYGGGATNLKSRFATNLPPYATEALNSPELVQLDVCGVITMYRQPDSLKEATTGGEESAAPATDAAESAEMPADESAAPAAEGTDPALTPEGTAPVTDPAAEAGTESATPAPGNTSGETPATPPEGAASDAAPGSSS